MYAASTTAPAGWLFADGTSYATSSYPRLWQIIQYTYGGATSTFNVPNFTGRQGVGINTADASTTSLGQTGGATSTTQVAAHTHVVNHASGDAGTGSTAIGGAPNAADSTKTTDSTGVAAVSIRDPYIVITYIIKY